MLNEDVRRALCDVGICKPTEIQEKAIPHVLRGKNVLIVAPAGWGKTEAAMAPLLSLMCDLRNVNGIKLVYITPLRSLNRDIERRISGLAFRLGFRVGVRHGDTSSFEREAQSRHPPDILITTPETLQAMLPGYRLRKALSSLRFLVVDELHHFLAGKRGIELAILISRLKRICNRDIQIVGLSATLENPYSAASLLSQGKVSIVSLDVSKMLDLRVEYPSPGLEDVRLSRVLDVPVGVAARLRLIRDLVLKQRFSLIFANSRSAVEFISSRLTELLGKKFIAVHHGSIARELREKSEFEAREGLLRSIVCTSSLELGLDIGRTDLVLQYGSPRRVINLVQRVGRSGHSYSGVAKGILIGENPLDVAECMAVIDLAYKGDYEPSKPNLKSFDLLALGILGLTLEKRGIELDDVYAILRGCCPDLSASEFRELIDILLGNKLLFLKGSKLYPRRTAWTHYYSYLSTIPEIDSYPIVNISDNKIIGELDANFVSEYVHRGEKFIFKGEPWRVVDYSDSCIYVSPEPKQTGKIPWWEGEYIPVSKIVAVKVWEILKDVEKMVKNGLKEEDIIDILCSRFKSSRDAARAVIKLVKELISRIGLVPSTDDLLVEKSGDEYVFHLYAGHRVNATVSRVLASLCSQITGKPVRVRYSAYGFSLNVGCDLPLSDVYSKIKRSNVDVLLSQSLETSRLLMFHILDISQRMGYFNHAFDVSKLHPVQLTSRFKGSLVYHEALNELKKEVFDTQSVSELFSKLDSTRLFVKNVRSYSPIAEHILSRPAFTVYAQMSVKIDFRSKDRCELEIFNLLKEKPSTVRDIAKQLNLSPDSIREKLLKMKKEGLIQDIFFTDEMRRVWFLKIESKANIEVLDSRDIKTIISRIYSFNVDNRADFLDVLNRLGPLKISWIASRAKVNRSRIEEIAKQLLREGYIVEYFNIPGGEPLLMLPSHYAIVTSLYKSKPLDERYKVLYDLLKLKKRLKPEAASSKLKTSKKYVKRGFYELQLRGLAFYNGDVWVLADELLHKTSKLTYSPLKLILGSGPKSVLTVANLLSLSVREVMRLASDDEDILVRLVKFKNGVRRILLLKKYLSFLSNSPN